MVRKILYAAAAFSMFGAGTAEACGGLFGKFAGRRTARVGNAYFQATPLYVQPAQAVPVPMSRAAAPAPMVVPAGDVDARLAAVEAEQARQRAELTRQRKAQHDAGRALLYQSEGRAAAPALPPSVGYAAPAVGVTVAYSAPVRYYAAPVFAAPARTVRTVTTTVRERIVGTVKTVAAPARRVLGVVFGADSCP